MKPALMFVFLSIAAIGANAQPDLTSNDDAVVIADNQNHPSSIAVDEEYVYWVSDAGTMIKRLSKAGGVPFTVVTGKTIDQIVVDEDSLYFTILGEIRRVTKSGGNAVTLIKADLIGYQRLPMLVDKTNLYYYEEVGVPPGTVDKNPLLRKVNKRGGVPVTLSSRTYMPDGLAADGTYVYWGDHLNDTVKRISVTGGRAVTIGRCVRSGYVAIDAGRIYCERVGKELIRLKRANDPSVTLSPVQNAYSYHQLVMDEMNLYEISRYKGVYGIYRIHKDRGQPELLVSLQFFLRDFTVDDTSIYWTDEARGTVMRLNK